LPYYNVDLPHRVIEAAGEIRNAMTLWSDEESRRHFVSQLLWLLKGDVSNLPPPMDCEPYFPPGLFGPLDSETFVDCGAFTGDTLRGVVERLHWPFRAYHALEPDPASFQALRHFVDGLAPGLRDRIVLHPVAASDRCRKVRFSGGGTMDASFDQNGAEEVQCVRMDDELAGLAVTMIKIDTEGAEREALCGAEQIIRQRRPILAVSAYHRQGDLWQLPLLIRSFGDDYRFYLHPHGYDSFDLVLYAIPRERAIHAR
jgi:FkbM family methyltransferase